MVMQQLTSIVLRPRRRTLALIPALVVLTAVGCNGHKRTSLRPVLVTPAPACSTPAAVPETVVPAPPSGGPPSGGPSSTVPSVVEPNASTLGAPAEPAPPSERVPSATPAPAPPGPGASSPSGANEEPPLLRPINPGGGDGSSGSSNGAQSPPASSGAQSPPASSGAQSPSTLVVPRLQAPGTSLNGSGQGNTTRKPRVTLREQLVPYTNNPDDLFAPPKADRPWKYVVLHHSAGASGSYETIDREHRKRLGWDGCGYHFVIGNGNGSPDGQIEVARRWSEQKHGIHCRNGKNPDVSEYGIGICLVGDLDVDPPTPRQIAAAQALVAYLGGRYHIPADHIGTHAHLARTPTDCPGKHFPAQAILGESNHLAQR